MSKRKKNKKKANFINAPLFNPDNGENYEKWKKKSKLWEGMTTLNKKKRGPALYMALRGRAESIVSLIPNSLIQSVNGFEVMIEKLDGMFLPDKFEKCF